ncbi:MAG: LacI family DNA-binding transcriptional regulator [Propioniciclava sp.]
MAQSLRNSGTLGLVALVVPDVGDPYFGEIYLHLQQAALMRGESLLLGSHTESLDLQRDLLRQMAKNRPASIILVPAPGTTAADVQEINDHDIPLIVLDRPIEGVEVDTVLAANEAGATRLVNQLSFDDGERVAIVSLPTTIWTQDRRFRATEQALAARGIEPTVVIAEPALSAPTGAAFQPIFDLDVGTILSMSVPPAMGVLRLAKQLGARAPRIACFDRHPWFDLVGHDIVSVVQDPEEVAHQVSHHVQRRRENPQAASITSVISFRDVGDLAGH